MGGVDDGEFAPAGRHVVVETMPVGAAHTGNETRVHAVAVGFEARQVDAHMRGPEQAHDLGPVSGEGGRRGLDSAAEVLEDAGRVGREGGDGRIDAGMAEIGAEGDATPGKRGPQAGGIVRRRRFQGCELARMRPPP